MNKQLFCIIALCASSAYAARNKTAADHLMAFNTMEKGHKDDWFKYMKEQCGAKADLLKKQHDEWADFRNAQIIKEIEEDLSSHEAKEELLKKRLNDAIALHKKQGAAWEVYAKSHADKAKQLCDKHKKDLSKFEEQLEQ